MNKEQVIRSFVKDEYLFLTAKAFTQQKFKKSFQEKYGNRFKKIDPKDLVVPLVELLRNKQVASHRILHYIETLPVFKDLSAGTLSQLRQIAHGRDYSSGLSEDDLELIKKLDAIDAAKELGVVERTRALEDLNRKIEEAKWEYESLPSVLEYEPIAEPDFDPKHEEVKQWWERFYLRENPFPQKDGLSRIDESLYEDVLVKTKPFKDCLGSLKANPSYLYDTGFLLVGDYGFGKTTFIDYLSYFLIQNNVLPIRITPLRSYPDTADFANDFYLQLRDQLRIQFRKISQENIDEIAELNLDSQIPELIARITKNRRNGIVVFLDDYHKHRSQFRYIYEFLGLLQILKNNLTRASLNVGFIVSGTPEWNAQLLNDGQLRGFLDGTPIEMPAISPELVCEVFNQRIKAFCYDESARKIKPSFVKLIFKQIEGHAGYREYLARIIAELKKNNLSIIDTPIEIEGATLASVRAGLEADDMLRDSFNKLVYLSKFKKYTAQQIAKCLELLIQTSIHEGLSETDRLFGDNLYYFNLLRETQLIQKRKRVLDDGTETLEWTTHERLQIAVDKIKKKHKLSINDYLFKIYGGKGFSGAAPEPPKQQSELADVITFFNRPDLRIPEAAVNNIRTGLRLYDGVLMRGESIRPTDEQIGRAWSAFEHLSDGLFEIDGSKKFFSDAGLLEVKDRWRFHLYDDEILLELLNRHDDYVGTTTEKKSHGGLVYKQLRDMFPSLAERLKVIVQDVSEKAFFGLASNQILLNKRELLLFDRIRDGYFSAVGSTHYDYIRQATDYLELKLREFLYATTTLVFGRRYEDHIPMALRHYSTENALTQKNYSLLDNAFAGMTRGQLRDIFTQGDIRTSVCNFLETGWTASDWKMFLDEFVVANINSSHQQKEAYSPADKDLYLNYCRRVDELIVSINRLVRGLIKSYSFLIYGGGERTNPENYFFKYSFRAFSKKDAVRGHVLEDLPNFLGSSGSGDNFLNADIYSKIVNSVLYKIQSSSRRILVEDLLEIEYITSSYNVSYQDFVHALAFAYFADKRIVVQPWFGSSILLKAAIGMP